MTSAEITVAALRGIHVAGLVSLSGTLLFVLVIAPRDVVRLRRTLYRLARYSALCALLVGLVWLAVESAVISDAANVATTVKALPVVAFQTQYGRWFVARCALLVVVLLLPLARRIGLVTALTLAAAALVMEPLLGHAGAIGGSVGTELIASETLHLLAAGAWLGGLLPLLIAVSILPHEAGASACRDFTPIGLSAVLLLAGTAVVQVVALMGGLPGLFGTTYGHVALVKLGLFLVLLMFAIINRFVLTERLAHGVSQTVRGHMRVSIFSEMILGAAVIVTAGFLASQTPGTHEQPVWPFPWRISAWAFADPDYRGEVVAALSATVVGVAVMTIGLFWRRIRWWALAVAIAVVSLAVPHLDLLLVEAYPTSFFSSPTEFAATAVAHGARLFAANCMACHGIEGHGDGPAAKGLPVAPADLTAAHFLAHNDGDLYWFISHGFTTLDGTVTMPGFGHVLSNEAIWDLIDYLHAHNSGYALHRTGSRPQPLPVPQFDAQCANGQIIDLDDLRGRALRLIAVADSEQPEPALPIDPNVTVVLVFRNVETKASGAACIASEPQLWTALAIIVGLSPDTLGGTQVLVDPNGWLRATWRPGDAEDWTNPQALAARVRDIVAHPLEVASSSGHVHRH